MATKRTSITLTLIAAGGTRWDQEGRMRGTTDLPLSNTGRAAAIDDAVRAVNMTAPTIYHPSDEASTETAAIFAERIASGPARTRAVADLSEPGLGLLEGMLQSEFAERYPKRRKQWDSDPLSLSPPDGEPFVEARARILGAAAQLMRKSKSDDIALVLHPIALGMMRCWLGDVPASQMWKVNALAPRVERFLLAIALIDRMRDDAMVEASET